MRAENRWKIAFWGTWLAAAALCAAMGLLVLGPATGAGRFLAASAAAQAVVGVLLYLLVSRGVFGPADRWRRNLAGGGPDRAGDGTGLLGPLWAAVSERLSRERETLEEAARRTAEKLDHLEMLRRDLEETKSHLENKVRDLRSIYEVSTAVAGTLDTDELFRIMPGRVMATLGLRDFCVLLYDPDKRLLACRAWAGMPAEAAERLTLKPGEGVAGRVFETGEAAYIPDVRESPESASCAGPGSEVRSFMSVPLLSKGRVIGVLNVNHPEPNAFDAESVATMRVLAMHMAIAIENAELFHFVKTVAEKDSLTLLYNHGAFHEKLHVELERASRYGRPLAVIMLDLDRFKDVNDEHGHMVGDRILVLTAGVLCAHLRKSDIPARYGGDEFAVILPETDLEAAATIASRIAAGISQVRAETDKGEVVGFSVSIGYAACLPDSPNRENILGVADRLMYESKRRGRGGVLGEQL